jgi:CRISPR-associated endonuclease/helicase Cas3
VLQQEQPFRRDSVERTDLLLQPTEEGDDYELVQLMDKPGSRVGYTSFVELSLNHRIENAQVEGPGIAPWGQGDYMQTLADLANELEMPLNECARRFGTVTLPKNERGWRFHPALGFSAAK